jgi:peptidoglycan/xylan/chitin deacetylase (PgdA/CDA1 family)
MFALKNIEHIDLPAKTLCLTYDDGPGPTSAEIGCFLKNRGIRATFFVVGKYAVAHPHVLDQLHADGHVIGNHTFEHPDLPYYVSINGDVRDQIIRTNTVIRKYNEGKPIYFRATYGKWSPEVARELNVDLRSSFRHVGPVFWDVAGIDVYYWRLGKSVDEAMATYLADIDGKGRGVVVMHDGTADMDVVAAKNKTLELTMQLVPRLQALGYAFIGLDEIDDPQLSSPRSDTFALQGQNGKYLQSVEAATGELAWSGAKLGDTRSRFVMEEKGRGKIAIRTAEGKYLRVNPDVDATVRLGDACDLYALFDHIPLSGAQLMLRSHNGNYLAAETKQGGLLQANAPFMRQAWCISYVPQSGAYLKPVTLSQRLNNLKRSALFVKSKVLQA